MLRLLFQVRALDKMASDSGAVSAMRRVTIQVDGQAFEGYSALPGDATLRLISHYGSKSVRIGELSLSLEIQAQMVMVEIVAAFQAQTLPDPPGIKMADQGGPNVGLRAVASVEAITERRATPDSVWNSLRGLRKRERHRPRFA